jgi:putative nucleotidyltransferase with HDIG domain
MSQATASTGTNTPDIGQRNLVVLQAMNEVSHIATLPEITIKIIELVEDPDSTAGDLHKIIANDPALCARVLKVVNSAFYGLPGQIGSINRAIVLLGLNAVKNIAIAASLAKLFRGGRLCPQFSARDLWTHSIAVAATVKLLSDTLKLGLADEAFLAGLMHDIGIMVEMQAFRSKLGEVFDYADQHKCGFMVAEQQVIGATHEDLGKALCEKWKFPRSFAFVTGHHHNPMAIEAESRLLTSLVYIADVLASRAQIGYSDTPPNLELDPEVVKSVGLTPAQIEQVTLAIPEAFKVADQLLMS